MKMNGNNNWSFSRRNWKLCPFTTISTNGTIVSGDASISQFRYYVIRCWRNIATRYRTEVSIYRTSLTARRCPLLTESTRSHGRVQGRQARCRSAWFSCRVVVETTVTWNRRKYWVRASLTARWAGPRTGNTTSAPASYNKYLQAHSIAVMAASR